MDRGGFNFIGSNACSAPEEEEDLAGREKE